MLSYVSLSFIRRTNLLADLAIRGTVACFLSLLLSREFSLLCIPVPPSAGAVINTAARVHPDRDFLNLRFLLSRLRCGVGRVQNRKDTQK